MSQATPSFAWSEHVWLSHPERLNTNIGMFHRIQGYFTYTIRDPMSGNRRNLVILRDILCLELHPLNETPKEHLG